MGSTSENALKPADRLFVIGYSLPQTDFAMRSLLWEGRIFPEDPEHRKKLLHVVDVDESVIPDITTY